MSNLPTITGDDRQIKMINHYWDGILRMPFQWFDVEQPLLPLHELQLMLPALVETSKPIDNDAAVAMVNELVNSMPTLSQVPDLKTYLRQLVKHTKRYPVSAVEQAFERAVAECKFPPSVALIVGYLDQANDRLLTVRNRVRRSIELYEMRAKQEARARQIDAEWGRQP